MIIQLIRIGYNHDTGRKFGNLIVVLNQGLRNSSVSAQKLKCPSSARLGTFIVRVRSSRKIPARTNLQKYISKVYLIDRQMRDEGTSCLCRSTQSSIKSPPKSAYVCTIQASRSLLCVSVSTPSTVHQSLSLCCNVDRIARS